MVCLFPSLIEIGVLPELSSSLTHSSLIKTDQNKYSNESENSDDGGDTKSDSVDNEG
jgi:hypothetical protein